MTQTIKEIIVARREGGFGLATVRKEGWTHLKYGDMSACYSQLSGILRIEHCGIDSLADLKSLIDALYEQHYQTPKKQKKGKKK